MREEGANADGADKPKIPGSRVAIVVASWNQEITAALLEGALSTLSDAGCKDEDVDTHWVPGSFELPYKAQKLVRSEKFDAVICLGSLIRGETIHFDIIAASVARAIQDLNTRYSTPTLFGVLTDENMEQARARSGGDKGNKGSEAAEAAIQLIRAEKGA